MARLGPEQDQRTLNTLLDGEVRADANAKPVAMRQRIHLESERLVLDLLSLSAPETLAALRVLLQHIDALFSSQVRLKVSDGAAMSAVLKELNTWSRDARWSVARREGTPHIDLQRRVTEATASPGTANPTGGRAPKGLTPAVPAPSTFGAPSIAGVDLRADALGLALGLLLAAPSFGLCYIVAKLAVAQVEGFQLKLILGLDLIGAIGLTALILLVVAQVVRPRHVHPCHRCGALNRIHPWKRRWWLTCGGCDAPIYGVWPILEHQSRTCAQCHTAQDVPGAQLRLGVPGCRSCGADLTTEARAHLSEPPAAAAGGANHSAPPGSPPGQPPSRSP